MDMPIKLSANHSRESNSRYEADQPWPSPQGPREPMRAEAPGRPAGPSRQWQCYPMRAGELAPHAGGVCTERGLGVGWACVPGAAS